jgi:hypothetical protein
LTSAIKPGGTAPPWCTANQVYADLLLALPNQERHGHRPYCDIGRREVMRHAERAALIIEAKISKGPYRISSMNQIKPIVTPSTQSATTFPTRKSI